MTRLIIRICGTPGASAHSLVNANILHNVLNTIQRLMISETLAASKSKTKSRRGVQVAGINSETRLSQTSPDDENDEDDEDELFASSQSSTTSMRPSQTRCQRVVKIPSMDQRVVATLLSDIRKNMTIFLGR
jgi:hypothetical protein